MQQHLTRIQQADLIAGHAVSYATAYLDGRHTAAQLAENADRLFLDLLVVSSAETSTFLVPVQLLAVAMMRAARNASECATSGLPDLDARLDRWHAVIGSLVDLVQHESLQLNKDRS